MSEVIFVTERKAVFPKPPTLGASIQAVEAPAPGVRDVRAELAKFSDKELVDLERELDAFADSGVSSPRVDRLLVLLGTPEVVEFG